jgi:hypothetical protein
MVTPMLSDFIETLDTFQKCVDEIKIWNARKPFCETNLDDIDKINKLIDVINKNLDALENFIPPRQRKNWQLPRFTQSTQWKSEDVFESVYKYFSKLNGKYEKYQVIEIMKIMNRINAQMNILWEHVPIIYWHPYSEWILIVLFPERR